MSQHMTSPNGAGPLREPPAGARGAGRRAARGGALKMKQYIRTNDILLINRQSTENILHIRNKATIIVN